jgi:hypothetical protein
VILFPGGVFSLFGVLGFNKRFQVREVDLPEVAVLIEPGIDGSKRFGVELIDAMAAFAMLLHQMRAPKQTQVFGNGRTRDWKRSGNFSRRLAASPEQIQDSSTGRIGQRLKSGLR